MPFSRAFIRFFAVSVACLSSPHFCFGQQVKMQVSDQENQYHFTGIDAPSDQDVATIAMLSTAGPLDRNSASNSVLIDGRLPIDNDDPKRNFFFAGSNGRILFDLDQPRSIRTIQTYSWHRSTRADQRYAIWVPTAKVAEPTKKTGNKPPTWKQTKDLASSGWKKLAEVDTRELKKKSNHPIAVCVGGEDNGPLINARYVLLEVQRPDSNQRFGDTFFSEIDIIDGDKHEAPKQANQVDSVETETGVEIFFDTSDLPEIRPWVDQTLKPACKDWYPRIAKMLPSENFQPPQRFTIFFHSKMDGVAYTQGKDVHCAGVWFQRNLNGEALGAVIHELVHVVQQYPGGRRRN